MIIRKPYAFLIKYFKIIHIIVFVLLTFSLFKLRNIYLFFRNYLINGAYLYTDNMASSYVGILFIIIIIFLIGIFLSIFLLMKQKKKPIIYYVLALVYSGICFISSFVFMSAFTSLEYNTFSNQALVLLRDLAMILYYSDYLLIIVAFVRGFGFNIKKFNFERDLKDLDITDSDREEIEINSSIDYEKITNSLRRSKRNFSYYIKENSYILTVFLVITLLIITSILAVNKLVYNKVYRENQEIVIDKANLIINNSYLTDLDYKGNLIKNNKKYVIVDFNIYNHYEKGIKLDYSNMKLKIDNSYYYAKNTNVFSDLGTVYKGQNIKANTNNNYIFVFELAKNINVENCYFEFYIGSNASNGEVKQIVKNIKINPTTFETKDLGKFEFNSLVEINNNFIKSSKFNISNVTVLDIDNYKYTKCGINESECTDYDASILPSVGKLLLKIEYSYTGNNDLFKYVSIKYKKNNKTYKLTNIDNVTPSNYPREDVVYLDVPNSFKESDALIISFDVRGTTFEYNVNKI